MNVEQAKVFFAIMETIKQGLADESISMTDAFTSFKIKVMENLDIAQKFPPEGEDEEAAADAEAEEEAVTPEPVKDKVSASSKGKKAKEEEPGPEPIAEPEPEVPKESPHFTAAQVKHIVNYVKAGMLGHYTLCRAVFSNSFESRKNPVVVHVRIDTTIPDSLSLADAVEFIEKNETDDEEQDPNLSAISMLVQQRIKIAAEQMALKLKENEKLLESRLAAIESKGTRRK